MSPLDRLLTAITLNGHSAAIVSIAGIVLGIVVLIISLYRGHTTTDSSRRSTLRATIRTVGVVIIVAGVLTALARWLTQDVLLLIPDHLSLRTWALIATGILALVLFGAGTLLPHRRLRRGLAALLATVVVVCSVGAQINLEYSAYPTLAALFGAQSYRSADAAAVFTTAPHTFAAAAGRSVEDQLAADWRAADGSRPTQGVVVETDIPGTTSGFHPRPAQVYVPPAYFAEPRPELPVVIALAGTPGSPMDWITSTQLPQTMDAFAAAHNGLAPIVVVADPIADELGNTLCVDSPQGNADTYLSVDVPSWITTHLQASTDPSQWAVMGFSFGGTCALQLALTHPQQFPTFLAMSAQAEPTIGSRTETLSRFFGGNADAFAAHNPEDILRAHDFPGLAGAFVVGADDSEYRPGVEHLYDTATSAGIDTDLYEPSGGHSFDLWRRGLEHYLPWLAQHTRLTSH